jgi:hypothetical protein
LWGSNIHWVGLGVTGNNGGFSHEKKGVLWFFPSNPLKYQWSVPLERSHCVSVKIPQGSTGVAVPFDRKRVVAFKCLKKVIYIYYILYIYIKMTYYSQWTWPKWVISYRLWRFVHQCYV